jgi:tight adherence protein C
MNPADILPAGMTPETALSLVFGIAAFITILALGRAMVPHDPLAARVRAHAERRTQLRNAMVSQPSRRGRVHVGLLRGIVEKLKLTQGEESRSSADKLAQAGYRTRDALIVYMAARLILPPVIGIAAWMMFGAFSGPKTPGSFHLIAAAAGAVAGAYGPALVLGRLISRRRLKIQKALPDALDLLVICAEAGLSLDGALNRVSREIGRGSVELADELGLTAIELGFLPERSEALRNLQRRVDVAAIRGVVNTLAQTERYGTPLAQSLRILAAEFRDNRMMRAEEKAGRLPATMTVPMMLFILPTLFIVLIGPAIINVLHTFKH